MARTPGSDTLPSVLAAPSAGGAVVPEDEAGFTALVRRHEAMVFGIARRALGNAADAEEVAQEIFAALYRHRASIVSEAHLGFWLRKATARRCIDHRRRGWRWKELPEVAAPSGPERDPWLEEKLGRLLGELPPRPRLVMILRYQEDRNPEEIAALLQAPLATVKSDLRRSLARLRRRLHGQF